jgi:lipoprotein-anchoring transpeptidase ErfK/SrfK
MIPQMMVARERVNAVMASVIADLAGRVKQAAPRERADGNFRAAVKFIVRPFHRAAGFVMFPRGGRKEIHRTMRLSPCRGGAWRRGGVYRVDPLGLPARRAGGLIVALGLLAMATGCADAPLNENVPPAVRAMYSSVDEQPYHVPTVNLARIDARYYRQEVPTPDTIKDPPGTIVVDPEDRFLYLVEADGKSMRYGIGVGREGFAWSGTAVVHDKTAWPKWFPPPEMVARDPKVAPYANGMEGGIKNPLGARALYLWQGNKDTLFRLHGTNEPSSIGHAVSSGCIRLLNQDIIDLYERVPVGTKVVVLPTRDQAAQAIDFQEHPVQANQL